MKIPNIWEGPNAYSPFIEQGSEFSKFGYENDKLFFNVEKFIKNEVLYVQSLNDYFW